MHWNPEDYVPVKERVAAFRATYPSGRIVTELVSRAEACVTFRTMIYRTVDEPAPAATGWASEREGDGEINTTACLENAETSSVGRALANLGFSTSRQLPGGGPSEAATGKSAARPAAPVATPSIRSPRHEAVEAEADALLDAILLLETAQRAGLPRDRGEALRRALTARSVPPSVRRRAEHELGEWLRARRDGDG